MYKVGNLIQVVLCGTALLAVTLVLFSDFLGSPLGGYAEQRLVLSCFFVVQIFFVTLSYAHQWPVKLGTATKMHFPALVLSFAYLLQSLLFLDQPYALVEPGMYAFFFLSVIATGAMLSWQDSAIGFARFLVLTVAASCALYG